MNWLDAHGFDATVLRQLLASTDFTDPDARVQESVVEEAWQFAGGISRDDALGVHLAEWLPRGALDLVEFAFRTSTSLGSGLERLAHYGRVLSNRVAAGMNDGAASRCSGCAIPGRRRFTQGRSEFGLALALKLAREGTGTNVVPVRVSFAHAASGDGSEHRRFFGGPVHFAAGSNSMVLKRRRCGTSAIGRRRGARRDRPAAPGQGARYHDRDDAGSFTTRVRRLVVQALGEGPSTADSVARALGVSRRTLSRRLAEENTSFSAILDAVREDVAKTLLQDRSLSIGDIAFFLQAPRSLPPFIGRSAGGRDRRRIHSGDSEQEDED